MTKSFQVSLHAGESGSAVPSGVQRTRYDERKERTHERVVPIEGTRAGLVGRLERDVKNGGEEDQIPPHPPSPATTTIITR